MKKFIFLALALLLVGCGTSANEKQDNTTKTKSAGENVKGVKGDKGDTGAQGIQGIKGIKGDKGDNGEPGKDGATIIKNNPVFYLAENPNVNYTSGDIVITQKGQVYMVVEPERAGLAADKDYSSNACPFEKNKVCIYLNHFVTQDYPSN